MWLKCCPSFTDWFFHPFKSCFFFLYLHCHDAKMLLKALQEANLVSRSKSSVASYSTPSKCDEPRNPKWARADELWVRAVLKAVASGCRGHTEWLFPSRRFSGNGTLFASVKPKDASEGAGHTRPPPTPPPPRQRHTSPFCLLSFTENSGFNSITECVILNFAVMITTVLIRTTVIHTEKMLEIRQSWAREEWQKWRN